MIINIYGGKEKLSFIPKKVLGHYIKSPFSYKFKKGINYITKNQIKFETGLKKVFLDINKNYINDLRNNDRKKRKQRVPRQKSKKNKWKKIV